MKRNVLLTMTALLTLWVASCGKSDSDTPITPEDKTPMKRVKEVNFTYIDTDYVPTIDLITNPHTTQNWSDIYNEKTNKSYTLKTAKVSYEYNEAGKITKLTELDEGREDRVTQFSYAENEMTITSKNDKGELESYKVQFDKDKNPVIEGFIFNNEGQLIQREDEKLTWENGNILKLEKERIKPREKEVFEYHFSYYTDKSNRNKFLLWDVEGMLYTTYSLYFDRGIGLPYGIATKNLVKSIVFNLDKVEIFKNDYTYVYDNEGYVTGITEQGYGREGGTSGNTYVEGITNSEMFKNFVERVKKGTEKGFTYKLVSDKDGKLTFEIIQSMKITKDSNGKPIDLLTDKVYKHTMNYTENNGVRTYERFDLHIFFRSKMVTNYQINY